MENYKSKYQQKKEMITEIILEFLRFLMRQVNDSSSLQQLDKKLNKL